MEISVDKAAFAEAEDKLSVLRNRVAHRKLELSFSEARGDTVEQLTELTRHLSGLRDSLAALYGATENAIRNTRLGFVETDQKFASYFNTIWERTDE